jgi:1,4-dihydroxy-2-naphthoate polyprenyltransferase
VSQEIVQRATASRRQRAIAFVKLGRPLHLIGGFVFHGLGIAIAAYLGASIDWGTALWVQVAITSIQLMTHYSNDYFDQDADKMTATPTVWASGSRVLPDGLLPPYVALLAALALLGVALLATVRLAATSAAPLLTLTLLLLALLLAWSYSSPPLYLNRRGMGEVSGALLVPALTTLVAFQVQTGQVALLPLLAGAPLACFQFAMLLSVNFPDAAGDALVGKRTLVVIFGPARAGWLFMVALALAYLLLPALVVQGLPPLVGLAVLLTSPVALWQVWRIHRGAAVDPAQWDALAFWSIGLLMAAALLEIAGFVALLSWVW